ncbi:MAG: hypothetical protein AAFX45_01635 [Pseudomonadota bacterium]
MALTNLVLAAALVLILLVHWMVPLLLPQGSTNPPVLAAPNLLVDEWRASSNAL